jgi:membrane-bound serine protease (ClpP class)
MLRRPRIPTLASALLCLAGFTFPAIALSAALPDVMRGTLAGPVPLAHVGIGLLALGAGLILVEALAPTVGVLGIGGVVAVVAGAGLLLDSDRASREASVPLLIGIALGVLVLLLVAVRMALAVRRPRALGGSEGLIGAPAHVLDWAAGSGSGHVQVAGERWAATGAPGLQAGQAVRVRAVRGLVVEVVAGPPPSP